MTGIEKISKAFSDAKQDNRAALMPYLTGAFPDRTTFLRDASVLMESADLIEVGLPYSDPLGDGPTIQASSQAVLQAGTSVAEVLDLIGELTGHGKPVLVMTYYNPIFCYPGGERGFLEALAQRGVAGVILPDLPPEEAGSLRGHAAELGLATVFLIAPTTTAARLRTVTQASSGFVYCVSVTGVTGARDSVAGDLPAMLAAARKVTDLPLAVGFGVSDGKTAAEVAAVADGVIVGSAIIARQAQGEELGGFAAELAAGCILSD